MLSISLRNIRIRAPHGLYPEEAERGNDFEVDVEVRLPAGVKDEWPLIDYARIHELAHEVMAGARVPLLEMLVRDIWQRIQKEWPQLAVIRVCVRKLRPPMGGDVEAAQVCFEAAVGESTSS
jgi:dihydroneopterin aldolase